MAAIDTDAMDQLFLGARTAQYFTDVPVSETTLRELYDVMKFGPTSMNCQPGRYVFLTSDPARERLAPALSGGNLAKVMKAPVTVILAYDTQFQEHLPSQFTAYDAKPTYDANPALAEATAFRNASLQGGYFILAARALGLGCGPMSGFDAARVNSEFFPDGRYRVNFLCTLGVADPATHYPRGPRLAFDDVAQIL
ncbi:malonic semialdehyde reductase [Halomonas shantousis]